MDRRRIIDVFPSNGARPRRRGGGGVLKAGECDELRSAEAGPSQRFLECCDRADVLGEHRDALWSAHALTETAADATIEDALDDYRHWREFIEGLAGDDRAAAAFERCWRQRIGRSLGRRFAPDLVDELRSRFFVRVHRLVPSNFRWQCPFTAYLRASLANLVRDVVGQLAHRQARERSEDGADLDALPSAVRSPEATLLAEERATALRRVLGSLPALDRHVVLRILLDGESGQDVAASLGMKPQALYMRLHRARRRIGELLERRGFLDGEPGADRAKSVRKRAAGGSSTGAVHSDRESSPPRSGAGGQEMT
ncbi:MAG: sigma-70 family RNA polymerase sigma factor [Acidobacteriota bacterium]